MHGRQKKERSAEEESVRQKEHLKKVNAYRFAMGLIFNKRDKQEFDEELLKMTGQVLASNPDIGTLWNIRKETLSILKQANNFSEKVVPKELEFTEFCLKTNPKSYGGWNHRYWLMKETNFSEVLSELKLCAKCLEYDDRNFHVWDYRRFLRENCEAVTVEQELEFTTDKISSNFSNFSSWHLRSKLLPKTSRDYLEDELELIKNAVFTDPKDQSAWFYHRWLLKSQLKSETPFLIGCQHVGAKVIFIFSSNVPSPQQLGIQVVAAENNLLNAENSAWRNPWNNTCAKLWELILHNELDCVTIKAKDTILKAFESTELQLAKGDIRKAFPSHFDIETKKKDDKLQALLKNELEWVQELQELEPDIKWPVSTLILLRRMIDFSAYEEDILRNLELLIKLDSKRINYYMDLRSKYLIEWRLLKELKSTEPALHKSVLDLSELNLTALYYPERIFFHTKVNLNGNALKNCEPFLALGNCQELQVSGNKLSESDIQRVLVAMPTIQLHR